MNAPFPELTTELRRHWEFKLLGIGSCPCEDCVRLKAIDDEAAAYHHTTELRPAYDPARSTMEQRLERASLSRAEGQE